MYLWGQGLVQDRFVCEDAQKGIMCIFDEAISAQLWTCLASHPGNIRANCVGSGGSTRHRFNFVTTSYACQIGAVIVGFIHVQVLFFNCKQRFE